MANFGSDFAMRMKAKNMNGNYCDVEKYFKPGRLGETAQNFNKSARQFTKVSPNENL